MDKVKIGYYAFVGGLILAILGDIIGIPYLLIILVALGTIVGLLNIEEKESIPYLISIIALTIIGLAGLKIGLEFSQGMIVLMKNFLIFVLAAGLVVAIKQVLILARPGDVA